MRKANRDTTPIALYNSKFLLFLSYYNVTSLNKLAFKVQAKLGSNDQSAIRTALHNVLINRIRLPMWMAKTVGEIYEVDYKILLPDSDYISNEKVIKDFQRVYDDIKEKIKKEQSNGCVVKHSEAKKIIGNTPVNIFNNPSIIYRGKKNGMYLYLEDVLRRLVEQNQ